MTTLLTGSVLVLLSLSGCERDVVFSDSGEPLVTSCLSVSSPGLDFGVTGVGDGPVERVLTLVNTCEEDDLGVDWVVASQPFDVHALLEVLIPPGGETALVVRFEPRDEGVFEGALTIATTDAALHELNLPLTGTALRSRLVAEPESWDAADAIAETPKIGCPSARELVLSNSGSAPLIIDGVDLLTDTEEFSLELRSRDNGPLPWLLGPGRSALVVAHYKPVDRWEDEAFVMVSSSDPGRGTAVISLAGDGFLYRAQHDHFEVTGPPAVDVLFTVDRSPSMASDLDRILAAIPAFFEEMAAAHHGLEWRAAAVVADDGCVLSTPTYVDDSTERGQDLTLWITMVDRGQALDTSSAHWESGFVLALAALDQAGAAGCNPGLLQGTDVPLHVVHMSDDGEQSDWPYTYYLSELSGHRDSDDLATVHALVGDLPSGCGDAEAGFGYSQAVSETGGQLISICTPDLQPPLRTLAQRIQGRPQALPLTEEPVPETIQVRTAGEEVLPPWRYDRATNSVAFMDQLPTVGTELVVSYHVMPPDCPQ